MTHCERVLELLRDGEWHSHHELYALHVVAHSRISDLRARGHVIEQRRDGDLYLYRLIGLDGAHGGPSAIVRSVEPASTATPSPNDGEGGLDMFGGARSSAPSPEVTDGPAEQLSLIGAAA